MGGARARARKRLGARGRAAAATNCGLAKIAAPRRFFVRVAWNLQPLRGPVKQLFGRTHLSCSRRFRADKPNPQGRAAQVKGGWMRRFLVALAGLGAVVLVLVAPV